MRTHLMPLVPVLAMIAACAGDPCDDKTTDTCSTDTTDTDTLTDTTDTTMSGDTGPTGDTGKKKTKAVDTVLFDFEGKDLPSFTDFDGGSGTVVADPTDGTNAVAQIVKSSTAQTWGGTTIHYCDQDRIAPLPFTKTETSMSMRVWSPDAGTVFRLKVEDGTNNTVSVETEATTTAAKTWETLTFDFANEAKGTAALNLANTYDKLSVFPNFGTDGKTQGGDKTYYVDDLTFLGAVFSTDCVKIAEPETFPITFDDANTTYTLTPFEGASDGAVVVDPDDAGNMVASVVKSSAAQAWGGVTASTLPNEAVPTIPLTSKDLVITMRVRSPRAGTPWLLKVEDATDPTKSVETIATSTKADTWETLTFDFANEASGTAPWSAKTTYDKVSVFPDYQNAGIDGSTFYFDDITP